MLSHNHIGALLLLISNTCSTRLDDMTTAAALRAAAQTLRSPLGIDGPRAAEAQLDALAAAQELRNTLDAMVNDLLVAIAVTEDPQLLADDDGSPRDLVEVHDRLEETYAAELAAPCLGVSVHVASTRCHNALGLATRAPALVEQMRAGRLDGFRATLVHGELDEAPAEVEAAIVDELVARAERRGQWDETAGPLTSRARALLARRAPAFVAEQAATQREQRGLTKRGDCMALDRWDWQVPVEESRQVWAAVDDLAQRFMAADAADSAIAPDRRRSAAQARSDALAAIVLDRTDVIVHLHAAVPEGSPTGATGSAFSAPAESPKVVRLSGFGSTQEAVVSAEWVRAAVGSGRAVIDAPLRCDPESGGLVAGDIAKGFTPSTRRPTACSVTAGGTHTDDVDPRYRVPAAISRFVTFRDKTCRFPNCNVSQRFCDLDHVIPWPDGPTSPSNLMALCRRHHRLKQRPGWSVRLLPDATTVWTDPVGRELTTRPVDLLGSSLPPAPSGADAGWSPLERHLADLLAA